MRYEGACSNAFARSDITMTNRILALVIPTNNFLLTNVSITSKSTSVRITHGAACPLNR